MKTKKLVSFLAVAVIFIGLYYVNGYIQYNKLRKNEPEEEVIAYESSQISLFIAYKPPKMSFGSGHKKMYLFSAKHILLDVCTFGEIPIGIKNVDINNHNVILTVKKTSNLDSEYIESWIRKNKKIGTYKILYEIE